MTGLVVLIIAVVILALIALGLAVHVVTQYEMGVQFRFGRVVGTKHPGLAIIIPIVDRLTKVTLRIITMPIQSQGIITKDNVSVGISAVAYFRIVDAGQVGHRDRERLFRHRPRSRRPHCAKWSASIRSTRCSQRPM